MSRKAMLLNPMGIPATVLLSSKHMDSPESMRRFTISINMKRELMNETVSACSCSDPECSSRYVTVRRLTDEYKDLLGHEWDDHSDDIKQYCDYLLSDDLTDALKTKTPEEVVYSLVNINPKGS